MKLNFNCLNLKLSTKSLKEFDEKKFKNSGLVHYWPFDNCLTDLISGQNLTMGLDRNQLAFFTPDRNGKEYLALNLNYGYVQAPDGIYFKGDFTITTWIILKGYSDSSRIIDFGNGPDSDNILLTFLVNANADLLKFSISNKNLRDSDNIFSTQKVMLNKWHFLSVVLNNSMIKVYFNGTLNNSGTMTVPANITRTKNYFGKSNWNNPYTNGIIDEFKIFDRALNETEILEEMQAN